MINSFSILKKSLLIYKKNFLIFLSVTILYFLAKLIISSIVYSGLNYGGLIFLILMIPILAWQNLAALYVVKNRETKIQFLNPYIKTTNQIIPFSITYALLLFALIGGFVLLIIPSIILTVYLSLVAYVYFFENLSGLNALSRSIGYVRGNWFNVARKVLFLVAILFFIGWIIPYFSAKIFPTSITRTVADFLVELLTTPISAIYLYLLYLGLIESRAEDDINEIIITKRKTKLKAICTLGFLAFLTFTTWMIIKNPDSFSYKSMEQKLTEEQKQEMLRLKDQYPAAQQIRIKKSSPTGED